ncbi:MAG: hypothetical protein M1816_005573 [Peltula sp. TS41687]|nr:MAG: hypothetical protein M1816_005573 [Peltula sp. TS41687]
MRPGLIRAWPNLSRYQRRLSANIASSTTSLIRVTNIPAPHTGLIRVLSLNRPSARNAISQALLTELNQHTNSIRDEGEKGPTRAVVLASEDDACFCAGADLKERATFTQPETEAFLAFLRDTFTKIAELPIPTITAMASIAFGGGLELALTTDFRVFGSTSLVALPETRLGIIPGAGGTYRLPALIGKTKAKDLILTGRRAGGLEAHRLGLCDRLVEITPADHAREGGARELVMQEAIKLAYGICEGGPLAIRAAKKAVENWQVREAENMAYDEVIATDDRNEALMAFREKRKPVFKGR